MRNVVFALALLSTLGAGASAQAAGSSDEQAIVQPVYWSNDYCGPHCQQHRWWRHQRWEARRHWEHHRRWDEHRYGYNGYQAYPRY